MRNAKLLTTSTIAAFALVFGLAACGGSSSPDSEKVTTTVAKDSGGSDGTTTPDDGGDDGGDDTPTTVVAKGGGEFCDDLATFINDNSSADVDVTDPDAYKAAIEDSVEQGRELLSEAPDELDDAVETLLDVQDKLISELEKVDYDFTKLPADAFSSMDSPEIEKANDELTAYVEDTCKIDMPDVTAATVPDMTVPEITAPSN